MTTTFSGLDYTTTFIPPLATPWTYPAACLNSWLFTISHDGTDNPITAATAMGYHSPGCEPNNLISLGVSHTGWSGREFAKVCPLGYTAIYVTTNSDIFYKTVCSTITLDTGEVVTTWCGLVSTGTGTGTGAGCCRVYEQLLITIRED
jgi:hypothetical protein